jgi:hypothetical protein
MLELSLLLAYRRQVVKIWRNGWPYYMVHHVMDGKKNLHLATVVVLFFVFSSFLFLSNEYVVYLYHYNSVSEEENSLKFYR